MEDIRKIIRKYRNMRGESQRSLAKKLGIADSAMAAYETGSRIPKIEVRYAMAKQLNVDPVTLSGIELNEEDEIRLLGKLLYKYCLTMKYDEEQDWVNVTLPGEFEGICKAFQEYEHEIEDGSYSQEQHQKKEFFIETWPSYDAYYQARQQNIDVNSGGNCSVRMKTFVKQENDFQQYKHRYLDLSESSIIEKKVSRDDLFATPDDKDYIILKERTENLKKMKKQSYLGYEELAELLWSKGYINILSIADLISIIHRIKVPSEFLLNDIEGILDNHKR